MKNKILFIKPTLTILAINLAVILLILFIRQNLPPEIPLFYGKPAGKEQLAQNLALTLPPIISSFIVILNAILIQFLKNPFLHQVLLGLMIVTTILSTITVLTIISLVGNF